MDTTQTTSQMNVSTPPVTPPKRHSAVRIAIVIVLVLVIAALIVAFSNKERGDTTPYGAPTEQTLSDNQQTQTSEDTNTELNAIETDLQATTFEGTADGL